jgi:hypothetical protein
VCPGREFAKLFIAHCPGLLRGFDTSPLEIGKCAADIASMLPMSLFVSKTLISCFHKGSPIHLLLGGILLPEEKTIVVAISVLPYLLLFLHVSSLSATRNKHVYLFFVERDGEGTWRGRRITLLFLDLPWT